ncbi:C-C motif chemokine 5-like [Megalops cyprinoides]|uniref:C-C motif chemokine 5-like n=1 Tax=Megalops cyprinoides TaxID=118141 RepID=UPI001864AFE6|nr:C-C motif chemokine 5-like [Megalops cyprinoides]
MKTSTAVLSTVLLAVALSSESMAKTKNGRSGCCVVHTKASQLRKLPVDLIKEYRIQEVTGSCNIPAVVFITRNNRLICANPKAKKVKQILKVLRGRKNKTQGPSQRRVRQ